MATRSNYGNPPTIFGLRMGKHFVIHTCSQNTNYQSIFKNLIEIIHNKVKNDIQCSH